MSISIGTRNLKFMQRGTQLPAASSTPPPQQSSNASSSEGGSRGTKHAPVVQKLPQQQEQKVETEEEEWVLPGRSSRASTRPSTFNKPQTSAGAPSSSRTRVVRQDSSYLSFISGTGAEGAQSASLSDDSGSDSDDGNARSTGEQPKNGRMTFGSLPTAERLDTSIVDQREEMKHLKAQETSSTRFKVFANHDESSGGKADKESKRKEDNSSSRARKGKERNDHPSASTTATPQKKPMTAKREGFLKPVLGEQRHQNPTAKTNTSTTNSLNQNPSPPSSSRRKKRKSGDRDSLDMQDSEVLVSGARAKRGKKTSKKVDGGKDRDNREVDMDDLAARVAGGGDDDVERYLQNVIHEMEE
ncbi:hypothetical protein QFC21_002300 [Naganishia friedmannii]|uniref:Uncharacterized protein n=1 Tax=Naganishia friedmannii TaxID=89922 RepID=A0ACC2VWN7_9TREE|nr:hypothetical protein QFC21_002300 [Naganishia friedmannii]